MQTKNMRLLKASVLCLSVFLLKQTGHAGLANRMKESTFKGDDAFYTGVSLIPDQAIEDWSKRIAELRLDWLLPLDPKQANDRKLVQQRGEYCNEFVGALPWALNNVSQDQHLKSFQNDVGAIASGQSASVKDVADRDVRNALKGLAENAPEANNRLAKLVLRKVAFGFSEVAKTIKETPDAKQAELMQYALQALRQSGVLEDLAVQPFANEFQALFQQASASAGKTPSRKHKSRSSGRTHRYPAASLAPYMRSHVAQQTPSSSSDDEAEHEERTSYGLDAYGQSVRHNPPMQHSSWGFPPHNAAGASGVGGFEGFQSEDDSKFSGYVPARPPAHVLPFEDQDLGAQAAALYNRPLGRTPSVLVRQSRYEHGYKQARNLLNKLLREPVSAVVIGEACEAAQTLLASLTEEQKEAAKEWLTPMQQGLQEGEYEADIEEAVNRIGGVANLMEALGLDVPKDDDHRSSSSSSESDSDADSVDTVVNATL